jgi:hypothetical protein
MPRGPKGERRPAVMVGRIATGEIEEGAPPDDGRLRSRLKARAEGMTKSRREEVV